MRKFIIEIVAENAAFDDYYAEIGTCLESVLKKVRAGFDSGTIRDTNGNTVGKFETLEDVDQP